MMKIYIKRILFLGGLCTCMTQFQAAGQKPSSDKPSQRSQPVHNRPKNTLKRPAIRRPYVPPPASVRPQNSYLPQPYTMSSGQSASLPQKSANMSKFKSVSFLKKLFTKICSITIIDVITMVVFFGFIQRHHTPPPPILGVTFAGIFLVILIQSYLNDWLMYLFFGAS